MLGVLMNGCPAQDMKSWRWSSVIITMTLGLSAAVSREPKASARATARSMRMGTPGCELTRSIPRGGLQRDKSPDTGATCRVAVRRESPPLQTRGRAMRKELLDGEQVFVIHDFLTPEECAEYVRATEAVGYAAAPISTAGGFVMAPEIRNNERVMIDNPDWAAKLWER